MVELTVRLCPICCYLIVIFTIFEPTDIDGYLGLSILCFIAGVMLCSVAITFMIFCKALYSRILGALCISFPLLVLYLCTRTIITSFPSCADYTSILSFSTFCGYYTWFLDEKYSEYFGKQKKQNDDTEDSCKK